MFGVGGGVAAGLDGDGKVAFPFSAGGGFERVDAVLPAANGSLIIVGRCTDGVSFDVCVARVTAAGVLDPTYGTGGTRRSGFPDDEYVADAVGLPDGSVMAVGTCSGSDGPCFTRFTPAGNLDLMFGTGGRVINGAPTGALRDTPYGLIATSDGGYATANICSGAPGGWDGCVSKFTRFGTRDTSFGVGGTRLVAAAPTTYDDEMYALAEAPDGSIVTFGDSATPDDWGNFTISRMSATGALDVGFDGDGIVTLAMSTATTGSDSWDMAYDGIVLADGRIVAAGECTPGGASAQDACIARLRADGTLDPTFSGDGRAQFEMSTSGGYVDNLSAIEVDAAGAYLATGSCETAAGGDDTCVIRVLADGTLDTGFGASGVLRIALAPGTGVDGFRPVTRLLEDGALGIGNQCASGGPTGTDSCAARVAPGASITQFQPGVADWATPATSMFGACLRATTSATATWTSTGSCPTDDASSNWNAIPGAPAQIAATATGATGTAHLRFGMALHAAQPAGSLIAPLEFSVVSP